MTDWKTYKGNGPLGFNFVEQGNKWGYLNNPRWVNPSVGIFEVNNEAEPLIWTPEDQSPGDPNDSETHIPCGHWHKKGGGYFNIGSYALFQQSIDIYNDMVAMVAKVVGPNGGIVCVQKINGTWYALGGVDNITEYMRPSTCRIADGYTAYFTSCYLYDDPTEQYLNYVGVFRFSINDYPRRIPAWIGNYLTGDPYLLDDTQIYNTMDCYGSRLACVARVRKIGGVNYNKYQVKVSNDYAMSYDTTWEFPTGTSSVYSGGYVDRVQVRMSQDGLVWLAYLRSAGAAGTHMIEVWKSNAAATSWSKVWEINFYADLGNNEAAGFSFDASEGSGQYLMVRLVGGGNQVVYESQNYGASFNTHTSTPPDSPCTIGTANGQYIVHSYDNGFYRSANFGSTFPQYPLAEPDLTLSYVDQQKNFSDIVYTECGNAYSPPAPSVDFISYLISKDNGLTWTVIQTPFSLIAGNPTSLPFYPGFYETYEYSGGNEGNNISAITISAIGSESYPGWYPTEILGNNYWETAPGLIAGSKYVLNPIVFWSRWITLVS